MAIGAVGAWLVFERKERVLRVLFSKPVQLLTYLLAAIAVLTTRGSVASTGKRGIRRQGAPRGDRWESAGRRNRLIRTPLADKLQERAGVSRD